MWEDIRKYLKLIETSEQDTEEAVFRLIEFLQGVPGLSVEKQEQIESTLYDLMDETEKVTQLFKKARPFIESIVTTEEVQWVLHGEFEEDPVMEGDEFE
jgi:hypothetical protein